MKEKSCQSLKPLMNLPMMNILPPPAVPNPVKVEHVPGSFGVPSPYFMPSFGQSANYPEVKPLIYPNEGFSEPWPNTRLNYLYHQKPPEINGFFGQQPSSGYFPYAEPFPQSYHYQEFKPVRPLPEPEKPPTKKSKPKSSKEKGSSPRKKIDRFDGIPEEEVAKKFLPDHIDHNLDILIIGINPGLYAAHKGHHYAGPGNHFWKCLYMSGLTPEQFTANDDFRMLEYGIGFTNIVARTTRGSADLSRKEIEEGSKLLISKVQYYKPKIAVFNGKGMYEIFSKKKDFLFGKQPETIEGTNTHVWVMPSSSARCSQLPRATDKVPFYTSLKKFRDYLNGHCTNITEEELVFSSIKLKNHIKKVPEMPQPPLPQHSICYDAPGVKPEM